MESRNRLQSDGFEKEFAMRLLTLEDIPAIQRLHVLPFPILLVFSQYKYCDILG